MEKKILIAIDHSTQATAAVQYAATLAAQFDPVRVTLLNIQPALSQYLLDESRKKINARRLLEKTLAENEVKARELLASATQRLTLKGVDEHQIESVTLPRNVGVADDILVHGGQQQVDAILVARRGATHLQQWFMGSVTANLVEHADYIPIWVVDGQVASDKILLAVDGSRSALRALDHMAFMLSDCPNQQIQILHVQPRFQDYCEITMDDEIARDAESALSDDDRICMDLFFQKALTVLRKNGFTQDQLHLETLKGKLSISRSILNFARENEYGTIVIGRSGRSKSRFTGSVSRSLLQKTEDMAIWVVP